MIGTLQNQQQEVFGWGFSWQQIQWFVRIYSTAVPLYSYTQWFTVEQLEKQFAPKKPKLKGPVSSCRSLWPTFCGPYERTRNCLSADNISILGPQIPTSATVPSVVHHPTSSFTTCTVGWRPITSADSWLWACFSWASTFSLTSLVYQHILHQRRFRCKSFGEKKPLLPPARVW